LVQVSPAFLDIKTFPALSTTTQTELDGQATPTRLFEPSMSCLDAVATPSLETDRFNTSPVLSAAIHDVVDVHTMPFNAVDPSTSVSFHKEESTWLALVAICTRPSESAIAQKELERQWMPLAAAEPA
jgi:hypothetical protein